MEKIEMAVGLIRCVLVETAGPHLDEVMMIDLAADTATVEERRAADPHLGNCRFCRVALDEMIERGTEGASAVTNGVHTAIVRWFGKLAAWSPLPAMADVPMADVPRGGTLPTYGAVESDLQALFPKAVLEKELAWATGPLRVAAAYNENGGIRSLRAQVGVRSEGGGKMILDVTDCEGHEIEFQLTSECPSDVRTGHELRGRLEDLSLCLQTETPR